MSFTEKHHENHLNDDEREKSIFKKSKIKRIVGKTTSGKINNSYGYAINSKVRVTWCSTMAYELLGHGYYCFFLDPKKENISFLHNENFNDKFRLNSYDQFKNIVLKVLDRKSKVRIDNKEDFCIDSLNISEKIYKCFKEN